MSPEQGIVKRDGWRARLVKSKHIHPLEAVLASGSGAMIGLGVVAGIDKSTIGLGLMMGIFGFTETLWRLESMKLLEDQKKK